MYLHIIDVLYNFRLICVCIYNGWVHGQCMMHKC